MARAFVAEVRQHGLIATAKHWLDNNQEINRQTLDVAVGDRAQHEIYMPPFKGAIDAGAGAVMCSYNKVGGTYACENEQLLKKLLREELGFKGFVVSDWGATHSGHASAEAGLNVEMPSLKFYKGLDGKVPAAKVDELAGQVLAAVYASGQFHGRGPPMNWKWPPPFYTDATSAEHRGVAEATIVESAILLKNRNATLPLQTAGLKIAMIGKPCHAAHDKAYKQGSVFASGGSGYVATTNAVTPLQGLRSRVGSAASVTWGAHASAAEGADVAVVCGAVHSEEGSDRADLAVPGAKELVSALRQQPGKKRIVLVAFVPGAVTTEWIDDVDAALVLFMPGEQVGPALAKLLVGDESPGGRLPVSFPKPDEPRFGPAQYPGVHLLSKFSEGVLVGYRWNDAKGVPSAFPFGFGLAYTSFRFSGFKATCEGRGARVSLTVANTGGRPGAAVPQLYVSFASLRPAVRQLRGFRKLHLRGGGEQEVAFHLGEEDWSFYDEGRQSWASAVERGEEVAVAVGTSSAELLWHGALRCLGDQRQELVAARK